MTADDWRTVGARLSNWGRWGDEDEKGTLNFVTPERVKNAASEIRTGKVFEMSIPIQADAPPWGGRVKRVPPSHLMSYLSVPNGPVENERGMFGNDDWILMPLQATTQWDGLAHVGYDGYLYNNVPMTAVTWDGASLNGVEKTLPGMNGRGVLLDIARVRNVDWLEAGYGIGPEELEEAEKVQGVRVGSGDALLVRTGWRLKALREGWDNWLTDEPGLTFECAEWLAEREVAAVACDNHAVEVKPTAVEGVLPLHAILIRDMGMPLGEIFDFENLAVDCADDGRWSFFFSAPPLRVTNGIGAPTSPIAIK